MSLRNNLLLVCALIEHFLNHYDEGFEDLYHPGRYLYNSFDPSIGKIPIQKTLSNLVSKGVLEKKNDKGYYKLTSVGWQKVGEVLPLRKVQQSKWDGLWRVVIYDVPEEKRSERDFLRWRLKELGFRLWQKSTWITPFNVSEELYKLLKEKKMTGRISVFESINLFGLNNRELTSKVWNLENAASNYQKLINDWNEAKRTTNKSPLKKKELARRFQLRYLEIAQKNSRLPVELLPENWPNRDINKFLIEIATILRH